MKSKWMIMVGYIQTGIAITFLISVFTGIVKAMWVLSGTSYDRTTLLLAQIIQGVILAFPLWLFKDGIDAINNKEDK